MNLLFLNSAKQWGGNENWVALATAAIDKAGHHTIVAYRSDDIGVRLNGKKIRLPFYSEMDVITFFRLYKIIRNNQIDAIIATKQKDYFLGGILANICRVPNLIRLGIVRPLKNSWSKRLLYDQLCDGIIVNARKIEETLLTSAFIRKDKICMVYNGVDITGIAAKSEQEISKKPFPFLIVSSGMLIKRKGFNFLLTTFARFLKRTNSANAGLLILGSGVELENLQQLSRDLKIDGNIVFQGYQQNPFPYLKQSDCFVMMSENEGISNALLEAMALKIPVITSASGGITEVIRDGVNGFIVDRNDEAGLANRMQQLYQQADLRKRMGEEGYRTILDQFSLETMAGKMIEFCSQMIRRRQK
jgi:glycosyltransferase involved in cell wall biosynthesis